MIILLLVAVICILSVFLFNSEKEPGDIERLYSCNGTLLGDASGSRKVVDLCNVTPYDVHSIELKTNEEPMGLWIKFYVDDRSQNRYIDYKSIDKMSALVFSVIPNVEHIICSFFDKYSNVKITETAFSGSYRNRNNMHEQKGMEKFTAEYISNSTATFETFAEYYNEVMSVDYEETKSSFLDMMYEFIGPDCEIVVNSGIGADIELNSEFLNSEDCKIIESLLSADFEKHAGKTIKITKHVIRNFKTNTNRKCVFVYYINEEDEGIKICAKYLDNEEEIAIIRNQITKRYGTK